jgi:hypothetical protein
MIGGRNKTTGMIAAAWVWPVIEGAAIALLK